MLKYLSLEDFKNFNLACKRFHEIVDNYPHSQLSISTSTFNKADAEILRKSRKLYDGVRVSQVYSLNYQYNVLEETFKRTGVFIKKLELRSLPFNRFMLQELLKMLPNLTSLTLFNVEHQESEEFSAKEETVHLTKLNKLEIYFGYFKSRITEIIDVLSCCVIEEVIFDAAPTDKLLPFLRTHEKSIKKLSLTSNAASMKYIDLLTDLKGLKLESLKLGNERDREKFSIFARNCPHLKHLFLVGSIVNDLVINVICDNFKELQTLQLIGFSEMTSNSSDNFHKLTKLRVLEIMKGQEYDDSNLNPLNGLRFAVNENLEELNVPFCNISPGSIAELKSCIPNVKKLNFRTESSEVILEVLKHFKNLEHLTIHQERFWEKIFPKSSLNEKVLLKLNYLHLNLAIKNIDTKTARRIVNNFGNVEFLKIDNCGHVPERSFKILLRGLKSLREIYLFSITNRLSEQVLDYVKTYGKKLQRIHLGVNYDFHLFPIREILAGKKGLKISGSNFFIEI